MTPKATWFQHVPAKDSPDHIDHQYVILADGNLYERDHVNGAWTKWYKVDLPDPFSARR